MKRHIHATELILIFISTYFAHTTQQQCTTDAPDNCCSSDAATTIHLPYGECDVFISKAEAGESPRPLRWPPANPTLLYSVLMVDPDAPSRLAPQMKYWLHWLVADVPGVELANTGLNSGRDINAYQAPTPPQNSAFHRYQFMLFVQGSDTIVNSQQSLTNGRGQFDVSQFIKENSLNCSLVATYQYQTSYDYTRPTTPVTTTTSTTTLTTTPTTLTTTPTTTVTTTTSTTTPTTTGITTTAFSGVQGRSYTGCFILTLITVMSF